MPPSSVEQLSIDQQFRGPPKSGNGGYVAGTFAAALTGGDHRLPNHGAVEVTLRAPTPLNRPLSAQRNDIGGMTFSDNAILIAEAVTKELIVEVPAPATWEEALAARQHSYSLPMGFHPLFDEVRRGAHPICFCCGAELAETEGLQVYSAPVKAGSQVAAAWIPHEVFADAADNIRPEFVWTALDCPGQMAWMAAGTRTGMLGRLTARIERPVRAGKRCVVTGWTMGSEGRKFFAGTALFNEANQLCAYAKAVWIGRVADV